MIRSTALAIAAISALVAGCSSSKSTPTYKTMTCKQWLHLANSADPIGSGLLDTANAYLDSTTIDPKGSNDVAELADTISGVCGPTRLADTKIIDLKRQVVDVFLSVHPKDRVG